MEELFAAGAAAKAKITTREAAIKAVEESTAEVIAAMEALTPEQVNSTVPTPFMTGPMTFFMSVPGRHMGGHATQIDYLQTCCGDMDWHM